MELGSRIKAARISAGLSQRQLCGEHITRNMLSQIENGSAHPSMKTLGYLAERLGKPISYFLDEQSAVLPNQQTVAEARVALALGDLEKMRMALDAYQEPDEYFFDEMQLLEYYWHIRRAQQAIAGGMKPYGIKLLYEALETKGLYVTEELRYRCRVMLAMAGEDILLEADEDALLARARQCADPVRRMEILAAAEDRSRTEWLLLQARALFNTKQYGGAAALYCRVPPSREIFEKLEICYRELGDYRQAYEYACKQRGHYENNK